MKKVSIEPCCETNKTHTDENKKKKLAYLYKRPDYLFPYGYNMKCKKRQNTINRLQNFLNRPVDRKMIKASARIRQLALPKVW